MPTLTLQQIAKHSDDEIIQTFMRLTDGGVLELDEATILRFVEIDDLAFRVLPKDRMEEYRKASKAAELKQEEENEKARIKNYSRFDELMGWWKQQPQDNQSRDDMIRQWAESRREHDHTLREIGLARRAAKAKAILEILSNPSASKGD